MKEETTQENTPALPPSAHVIAGWPLVMVAVGGAIGGLCGAGAYGLSMALLKKKGVTPLSVFLSFLLGLAGIGLYFVVIIALAIAFPQLFGGKS
ncbi:MAG: hypothetical protein NTV80_13310 [Verrucomicrobia bacterium]|nr:hypothetical protein [Verrucomicrobiota bacterium]